MALSLVLEAAEVMEHFQWKTPEEAKIHAESHKPEIADEPAGAAMYLVEPAGNLGETVLRKLEKNAEKYRVKKAKGRHAKDAKL